MTNGEECPADKALAMSYRVKLNVFEGPLDLLLHLVKKNEVELPDIPITEITDQYLAYLDLLKQLDLDIAGEYLVMAASLLYLKSRLLLPLEETPEEEEGEDPRAELARQLLEYQRFKEAAETLIGRELLNRDVFMSSHPCPSNRRAKTMSCMSLSLGDLLDALQDVMTRVDSQEAHQIMLEHVSLRGRLCAVLDTLREKREVFFEQLFPQNSTRLQVLVTFLAVLELVRNRMIQVRQENPFGPIVASLAVRGNPPMMSYKAGHVSSSSPEEPLPEALGHL